jgi:hypothetical protein
VTAVPDEECPKAFEAPNELEVIDFGAPDRQIFELMAEWDRRKIGRRKNRQYDVALGEAALLEKLDSFRNTADRCHIARPQL